MDKYVAFIDILGFKDKLKKLSQQHAETFIIDFYGMLYDKWELKGNQNSEKINAYAFSDSIVLHTADTSDESMELLIEYLLSIYQAAFSSNDVLLRGAIAKGEFSKLPTHSFKNLEKGMIVGQAFVDAYMLESSSKGSLIIFGEDIKLDLQEFFDDKYCVGTLKNTKNEATTYSLRWADIDYLLQDDSKLRHFVDLACEAKWISHYYQTLHMFLINVSDENKKKQIFDSIFEYLNVQKGWRQLDNFIKNAFSDEVDASFQTAFLGYIRRHIGKYPSQRVE